MQKAARIKWMYVVTYRKNGKMRDDKFPSKTSAINLTERLRRNKVHYTFWRCKPEHRATQLLRTRIHWALFNIAFPAWLAVIAVAISILATVLWRLQ